ncbi:hypothetical protein ACWGIU_03810 [Streptomyces sp. NPDC054840]
MSIGPARFKLPEHPAVSYAWVRRIGRTRVVFEIAEPSPPFPSGTLSVHRYPAVGDGPAEFSAHFYVIPPARREAILTRGP